MFNVILLLLFAALPQPAQAETERANPIEERLEFLTSIHIPKGTVAGEAVCLLCSIRVDGEVRGEVVAVLGDVVVSGSVTDEVVAAGGNVHLLAGSRLGDEVIAAGGRIFQDPEATVRSTDEAAFLFFPGQRSFPWPGTALFFSVVMTGMLLAAGLLRHTRSGQMKAALRLHAARAIVLAIVGIALIGFLLGFTSTLGPLSDLADLLLTALLLVPAWLGSAGLVRLVGDRLFPDRHGRAVVAGSLALVLLMLVPVLGLPVLLTVFVLGWGVSLLSGLGSDADWLFGLFRREQKRALTIENI